jgi:hypothetical protein
VYCVALNTPIMTEPYQQLTRSGRVTSKAVLCRSAASGCRMFEVIVRVVNSFRGNSEEVAFCEYVNEPY